MTAGLNAICSDSLWKLSMLRSSVSLPTGCNGKSSSGHTCEQSTGQHAGPVMDSAWAGAISERKVSCPGGMTGMG